MLWSCRSPSSSSRRLVVQHQDGAAQGGEELLQRQNLPAISQRVLRQQPHLGQAVESHARGPVPGDALHHRAGGLAQFDLRRMQDRLLAIGIQPTQVSRPARKISGDPFERPAVSPPPPRANSFAVSGQGDIERPGIALPCAFQAGTAAPSSSLPGAPARLQSGKSGRGSDRRRVYRPDRRCRSKCVSR